MIKLQQWLNFLSTGVEKFEGQAKNGVATLRNVNNYLITNITLTWRHLVFKATIYN
jgi:hypothetical protein